MGNAMSGSIGLEDRRDVKVTIETNETAAGLAETGEPLVKG